MMTLRLLVILMLTLVSSTLVVASDLDAAQDLIDEYYRSSQEKDVERYSALFDPEHVTELYGEDYESFFAEVLSYIDITRSEIDYQYYTESEESLTLFYNLKAQTVVEGSTVRMDNDLVAFFAKKEGRIYLQHILLQETFIEQMNRELIYTAAIMSYVEEGSDLKKEADEKGISVIDYESLIDKSLQHERFSAFRTVLKTVFFVTLVGAILVGGLILAKNNVKSPQIRQRIDRCETALKRAYAYLAPLVRTYASNLVTACKKAYAFLVPHIRRYASRGADACKRACAYLKKKSASILGTASEPAKEKPARQKKPKKRTK